VYATERSDDLLKFDDLLKRSESAGHIEQTGAKTECAITHGYAAGVLACGRIQRV
jgi:hypothetical protein